MDGNAELLNFVYQNAQMGVETIGHLLEIAEGARFRAQLKTQLDEYRDILKSAQEHLEQRGHAEKDVPAFQKLTSYLMINMKTLVDKSPSHIAEMLIIGSNMGIIEAIKDMRRYADADKDVLKLMQTLRKIEENNIQSLRDFL